MSKNIWKNGLCIFGFLLFLFLLFPKFDYAYVYSINYSCESHLCITGKEMTWIINLNNQGENDLKLSEISIRDALNKSTIANLTYDYDPSDSNKLDCLDISSKTSKKIYLSSQVPKPNQLNSSFIYNFCSTTVVDSVDSLYTGSHAVPYCYKTNESIKAYECLTNGDCKIDSECIKEKCVALVCDECQYASNHSCRNYSCCESVSCEDDESCENHFCLKLPCENNQIAINHSCINLECKEDEYAFNHSCVKLNCSYKQYPYNNSCIDLECLDDEYISNRSCVKLNCSDDYRALNGSCSKLICLFNETAINHSCVGLECGFFQRMSNHQCIKDNSFLVKFLFELLLFFAIVFLIVKDFFSYKQKGDKG